MDAESVTLSTMCWSIIKGGRFTLTATVLPENATNKTIIWSSSDEGIVAVSKDGVIKAISEGTAVVTATTTDGSGKYASCSVTVAAEIIMVESLTIDPEKWSGDVGEEFTITATILPKNASDKSLDWSSSNKNVATVDDNGNVKVLKSGSCMISVHTQDGSGLKAICYVTVNYSGVESVFADIEESADIYNMQGVLLKKDCSVEDLRRLVPGIYILRSGGKSKTVNITGQF